MPSQQMNHKMVFTMETETKQNGERRFPPKTIVNYYLIGQQFSLLQRIARANNYSIIPASVGSELHGPPGDRQEGAE
jgi:hypothetical protein